MRASCVLIESGSASTEAVIHVDAIIFAVGVLRVDTISSVQDVNRLVPINNLVELRWYAGCRFSRDSDVGTVTISQQAFAENTAARFGVRSGRNGPLSTGLNEARGIRRERTRGGSRRFRELVGCFMWLANQTRPDIAKEVRAVARYANKPREVHWSTAIGISEYVFGTSEFRYYVSEGQWARADCAGKATNRRSVSRETGTVMCAGAWVCWFSRTLEARHTLDH